MASSNAPTVLVIVASTRPGRAGLPVANWFVECAKAHDTFQIDIADLAVMNLPFLDESHHPVLHNYQHQHTKDWSAWVEAADAVVLIFPEYNHAFTAPLKNALDYLNREWAYKPVGLVSYGGVSAGLRAANMAKQVLTALKMTPRTEAVSIPWVRQLIVEDVFQPTEALDRAADVMLSELLRYSQALRVLRPAP